MFKSKYTASNKEVLNFANAVDSGQSEGEEMEQNNNMMGADCCDSNQAESDSDDDDAVKIQNKVKTKRK